MRYLVDPSVRRTAEGRVLIGGSPLRLFRLTAAGRAVVEEAVTGGDVAPSPARIRMLGRLVEAGVLHPRPEVGPFAGTDVTVVVPVRDRADGLDRLLRSVAEAGARDPADLPAAVVVVDDASSDAAAHARVAAAHGAELVRRERSGGPGVARADGIARVRTPLVAVLDSDCVVTPGWLGPLLGHFVDDRVGAVAAHVRARNPFTGRSPGALARYDAVRSPLDLGPVPGRVAPRTRIAYVPAAGVVLRREAHDQVGGFDPGLRMGEDVDLAWRLVGSGWRVRYEPSAEVHHEVRPGLGSWLRQRFDYGTSAAALDARHPGLVAPVSCSPWSAGSWAAVAAGHPVLGATVAAGSVAALPRRLPDVPMGESVRLAALGHLGAGRLLARAVVRVWWPVAVGAGLVSRRARRVLVASAAVVVADAWVSGGRGAGLDPARFAALALADDAAYGAGVWWGCLRDRSFRALLPSLTGWPARADQPMKDAASARVQGAWAVTAPAQRVLAALSGCRPDR